MLSMSRLALWRVFRFLCQPLDGVAARARLHRPDAHHLIEATTG
jgi:hypothetical protein